MPLPSNSDKRTHTGRSSPTLPRCFHTENMNVILKWFLASPPPGFGGTKHERDSQVVRLASPPPGFGGLYSYNRFIDNKLDNLHEIK